MFLVVLWCCHVVPSLAMFFNYYGNNYHTYYPGQMVLNTIPYYNQRLSSTVGGVGRDNLPGFPETIFSSNKSFVKLRKLKEDKNFDLYLKTYFGPKAGIPVEVLQYKFDSLESNMESLEQRKSLLMNKLKELGRPKDGDEVEEFWFLQYQSRAVRKLMKAFNSTDLLPYSKLLVPGVRIPWNSSAWIKSFDEIFEELQHGEPLVEPELFKKQKAWWIQNRKKICVYKINELRKYIKTVDNFFYQNRAVVSVARWIKDREILYKRKLSDMFWWLCRRDQYYREEYARLDFEKVWTPWLTTTVAPQYTTFDYFRFNGDFHYLLRRRNRFYAKFFKRKKIANFIRRLEVLTTPPSTHQVFGYLFNQYKYHTVHTGGKEYHSVVTDGKERKELMFLASTSSISNRVPMKSFCFQYFGKVKYVGLRSTIYNRVRTKHSGTLRGYIMYTHRGTVFGKICGHVDAVDDMKDYIKKLKTSSSKVTKLEIRGESPIRRYPKGLKKFYYYKGLFEDSPKPNHHLLREYRLIKPAEPRLAGRINEPLQEKDRRERLFQERGVVESVPSSAELDDSEQDQVDRLFAKYNGKGDVGGMRYNKHNLHAERLYEI
uniref:Acylphosphatase-like domain-containing protein n=1 Tax=Cacopsylla melanoneura TaxID=428564 RepID=A0A8D8PT16_9HEMI